MKLKELVLSAPTRRFTVECAGAADGNIAVSEWIEYVARPIHGPIIAAGSPSAVRGTRLADAGPS